MDFRLREIRFDDLVPVAHILYEAFYELNASVGLPGNIDFTSVEMAISAVRSKLVEQSCAGVVATEADAIAGVGFIQYGQVMNYLMYIAVSSKSKNKGVGKAITLDLLKKSSNTSAKSTRLVQAASNTRSFSLYAKLGFSPVEYWNNFDGPLTRERAEAAAAALGMSLTGYTVRTMEIGDLDSCSKLSIKAMGFDNSTRLGEKLVATRETGTLRVVCKDGVVVGYTTGFVRSGHLVAASQECAVALYSSATHLNIFIVGQLYPLLLHWSFKAGLKLIRHGTVMVLGHYQRPQEGTVCSIYTG